MTCPANPRWDSVAPRLADDLVRDGARNFGVAVELHGVDSAALRLGAQVANVSEHLGQRDLSLDDAHAVLLLSLIHIWSIES